MVISLMNFLNTNISDILKVDGGHCMVTPRLHHAASQPPLLCSSIELEDLVIVVVTTIVIVAVIATWDANICGWIQGRSQAHNNALCSHL